MPLASRCRASRTKCVTGTHPAGNKNIWLSACQYLDSTSGNATASEAQGTRSYIHWKAPSNTRHSLALSPDYGISPDYYVVDDHEAQPTIEVNPTSCARLLKQCGAPSNIFGHCGRLLSRKLVLKSLKSNGMVLMLPPISREVGVGNGVTREEYRQLAYTV